MRGSTNLVPILITSRRVPAYLGSSFAFIIPIAVSTKIGSAVLKLGPELSISSMALAAIVGMVLNAVPPGAESAGDTGAILGDA